MASAGTPSSATTMLRTRMSSVYSTSAMMPVVSVSPVSGMSRTNMASDGIAYSVPVIATIGPYSRR